MSNTPNVQDTVRLANQSEERVRKRLLLSRVAFAFAAVLTTYLFIIAALMPGISPAKVVGAIAAATLLAAGVAARHERFYQPSAIAVITVTIVAGLGASISNGGLEGYVTPILITAPIAAALFLGARATMMTAICVVFAFCIQLILDDLGAITPTAYSPAATRVAALIMLSTATVLSAAGLSYFARDADALISSLFEAQENLVEMANKMTFSAYHDALTGLANRKKLNEELTALLSDEANIDARICLMHVDLDKFKEVNDTLGHPVGDGVLRKSAKIMKGHFRKHDLIARVGGDEFVIVASFRKTDSVDYVQRKCEALIAQINEPMSVNGVECQVGASIGYVFADKGCSSAETLVGNADIALYEAKRAGRGVARHFTAKMRNGLEGRVAMIAELEAAIDEGRVTCLLQPQLCLRTGAVAGFEALGRIEHPTRGLLAPAEFIDIAIEIGVIDVIDNIVATKALKALKHLRDQGYDVPRASVNVSSKSLRACDYADNLQQVIAACGLNNNDLVVEVREAVVIEDEQDLAAQTIRTMKNVGIQTLIDDFGTGYASMGNLSRLDVDGLKIDRQLVADLENERSLQVIKAILGLAHALHLSVTVEGIETPAQYAAIKALDCDYAQGYGLSQPLELVAFERWLKTFAKSRVSFLHQAAQAV